jgi:K+-transporting ATPase ATPase B chain
LLIALTLVFLLATATLLPFSLFSVAVAKLGAPVTITVLVALLVCLIPTTIGGLLSAIGVAGMSRMMASNVIATSGRAVEAAGDVDVLAARQDRHHHPGQSAGRRLHSRRGIHRTAAGGRRAAELAGGRNAEGRSIVVLAKQRFNLRERNLRPARGDIRAVLRANAHERRQHRRA